MKFTFDLFQGDKSPSEDFVGWVPKWWYRSVGLPLQKGVLASGDEWLLAGWFLGDMHAPDVVNRFVSNRNVETLFQTDGQFVLIVYLKNDNALEVYRDRIGVFPIVYAKGKNGISISMWIDNARQIAGIDGVAANAVLEQWPVYRKTFAPYTPFESIRSLSAENSLYVRDSRIFEKSHPMYFPRVKKYGNQASASNELGEILSLSVFRKVRNRDRLGVLLSGGTDSSLTVALIRKYYYGKLRTLFVAFEDNQRDYAHYADQVAKRFETDHIVIRLSPRDYVQHWAETIKILQTPLPMPCTIGIASALRELSGTVDMMIDGEGADTVFGSSFWPEMFLLSKMGGVLPRNIRDNIRKLSSRVPDHHVLGKALGMAISALATPLSDYPHAAAAIGSREDIDAVFGGGIWDRAVEFRKSLAKGDFFDGLFSYLMLHGIPEDLATSVRLGLDQNLFFSYPFLDYQLLQASMKLPNRHRYHYRIKKAPLKLYSLNFFDREFVYKPKEGFGVPFSKWFTRKEFDAFLRMPLEARSLQRGWWQEKELKRMMDIHRSGSGTDVSAESIPWVAANLELWARICIEGDSPNLYK